MDSVTFGTEGHPIAHVLATFQRSSLSPSDPYVSSLPKEVVLLGLYAHEEANHLVLLNAQDLKQQVWRFTLPPEASSTMITGLVLGFEHSSRKIEVEGGTSQQGLPAVSPSVYFLSWNYDQEQKNTLAFLWSVSASTGQLQWSTKVLDSQAGQGLPCSTPVTTLLLVPPLSVVDREQTESASEPGLIVLHQGIRRAIYVNVFAPFSICQTDCMQTCSLPSVALILLSYFRMSFFIIFPADSLSRFSGRSGELLWSQVVPVSPIATQRLHYPTERLPGDLQGSKF